MVVPFRSQRVCQACVSEVWDAFWAGKQARCEASSVGVVNFHTVRVGRKKRGVVFLLFGLGTVPSLFGIELVSNVQ